MGLFNKRKEREFEYNVKREVERRVSNMALAAEVVEERVPLASAYSNTEFVDFLENMDYTQWTGALELIGFGSIDTELLKWHLYDNGSVLLYRNRIGTVEMALPVPSSWNSMNGITACRTIHPRSDTHPEHGEFVLGKDAVLIRDTQYKNPSMLPPSRKRLVSWSIQLMSEIFARLKINIMLSGDKVWITTPDPKTAGSVKKTVMSAYQAYDPVVVLNTALQGIDPKHLQSDAKFMEIFGLLKQTDIWRQSIHGLGTGSYGIDKKERLITAEADAGKDNPEYQLEARIQLWKKQLNELKIFGDVGFGMAGARIGGINVL